MRNSRPSLLDLLFREHRRELLTFAGRRSGSALAEDAVQDAFLRLAQRSDLDEIRNPRAYLYKVVGRIARRDAARNDNPAAWSDQDVPIEGLPASEPTPDAEDEQAARLSLCVAALAELPDLQRHAFLLHRVDGLTHAEVAATLGLSKRSVERYVAKALAHCLNRLAAPTTPSTAGADKKKPPAHEAEKRTP